MAVIAQLKRLGDQEIGVNKLTAFLPYRKGAKDFNYAVVGAHVLSMLMGKRLGRSFSLSTYKDECLSRLKDKLSDESVLVHLDSMYFAGDAIYGITPEFMLLRTATASSASDKHLVGVFSSFLADDVDLLSFETTTNYIEDLMRAILIRNFRDVSNSVRESYYLPFIADLFRSDVEFLSQHSEYFLEQLPNLIELYSFIYCSQLGLNIGNWHDGSIPKSRPLYFILDTEIASSERSRLKSDGHRALTRGVSNVFPILSMLAYFNRADDEPNKALWEIASEVRELSSEEQRDATWMLDDFAERFRTEDSRRLDRIEVRPDDVTQSLSRLFEYAVRQFSHGTARHRVQNQYLEVFEKQVAGSFIQVRGRAGKVLVVNQDFVLLLTNLSIGDEKALRFQDVLRGFEVRGFYFDKRSVQAMIDFYERVGNVDRKSDSGDAVYVRRTF